MLHELVIKQSKEIESLLSHFGGKGKGVYEKAANADISFSSDFLDKVRYIARVRNEVVHGSEESFSQISLPQFRRNAYEVRAYLEKLIIDNSNQGKDGSLTICPSCGRPTSLQSIKYDVGRIDDCCVLCSYVINVRPYPIGISKVSEKNILSFVVFLLMNAVVFYSSFYVFISLGVDAFLNMFFWVEYLR